MLGWDYQKNNMPITDPQLLNQIAQIRLGSRQALKSENIGIPSESTLPSNLSPSDAPISYPFGKEPITNQELDEIRANNQSVSDHIFNFLGKIPYYLTSDFLKTGAYMWDKASNLAETFELSNPSYLSTHPEEAGKLSTERFTRLKDNPIIKTATELENFAERAMPSYKTQEYQNASPLGKVFHLSQYLDDQGASMAGFLASAYVEGYLVSGFGVGKAIEDVAGMMKSNILKPIFDKTLVGDALSTLGEKSTILTKNIVNNVVMSNKLGRVAAKVLPKIANTDQLVTSYIMSSTEAMFEGSQTYDTQYKAKYDETYNNLIKQGYSDQVAKDQANRQAEDFANNAAENDAFWNMFILMPSSIWETKVLFGKKFRVPGVQTIESLESKYGYKQILKNFGKSALEGIGVEGVWEENMQQAVQEYQNQVRTGKASYALSDEIPGILKQAGINFTTEEGQSNIIGGALMGLVMGGISGISEGRDEHNQKIRAIESYKKEYTIDKLNEDLEKLKNISIERDPSKGFVLKQKVTDESGKEVQKTIFDDKGNPVIDKEEVIKFLTNLKLNIDSEHLGKALEYKGNDEISEHIRQLAFNQSLYTHVANGMDHILTDKLEGMKQDVEKSTDTTPEQRIEKITYLNNKIAEVKKGRELYNTIKNTFGNHITYKHDSDGNPVTTKQGEKIPERLYNLEAIFKEHLLNKSLRNTREYLITANSIAEAQLAKKYSKEIEEEQSEKTIGEIADKINPNDVDYLTYKSKKKQLDFVNEQIKQSDEHYKQLTAGKEIKLKERSDKVKEGIINNIFNKTKQDAFKTYQDAVPNGGMAVLGETTGSLKMEDGNKLIFTPNNKNLESQEITQNNIGELGYLKTTEDANKFQEAIGIRDNFKAKQQTADQMLEDRSKKMDEVLTQVNQIEEEIAKLNEKLSNFDKQLEKLRKKKKGGVRSLSNLRQSFADIRDTLNSLLNNLSQQVQDINKEMEALQFLAEYNEHFDPDKILNNVALKLYKHLPDEFLHNMTMGKLISLKDFIVDKINSLIGRVKTKISIVDEAIQRVDDFLKGNKEVDLYDMLSKIAESNPEFAIPDKITANWIYNLLKAYDEGGKFANIDVYEVFKDHSENISILRDMASLGYSPTLTYQEYAEKVKSYQNHLNQYLRGLQEDLFTSDLFENLVAVKSDFSNLVHKTIEELYKRKMYEWGIVDKNSLSNDLSQDDTDGVEPTEEQQEERNYFFKKTTIFSTAGNEEKDPRWHVTLNQLGRVSPHDTGYVLKVINSKSLAGTDDLKKAFDQHELDYETQNPDGNFLKVVLCKIVNGQPQIVHTDDKGNITTKERGTRWATTTIHTPEYDKFAWNKLGIKILKNKYSINITDQDIKDISLEKPIVVGGNIMSDYQSFENFVRGEVKDALYKFRENLKSKLDNGESLYLEVKDLSRGIINFNENSRNTTEVFINPTLSDVATISIASSDGKITNVIRRDKDGKSEIQYVVKGAIVVQRTDGEILPVLSPLLGNDEISVILQILNYLGKSEGMTIKDQFGKEVRLLPDYTKGNEEIAKPSILNQLLRWGNNTVNSRSIIVKSGVVAFFKDGEVISVKLSDVLDPNKNQLLVEFLSKRQLQINRSQLDNEKGSYHFPKEIKDGVLYYTEYKPVKNSLNYTMSGYMAMVASKVRTKASFKNGILYHNRYLVYNNEPWDGKPKSEKKESEVTNTQTPKTNLNNELKVGTPETNTEEKVNLLNAFGIGGTQVDENAYIDPDTGEVSEVTVVHTEGTPQSEVTNEFFAGNVSEDMDIDELGNMPLITPTQEEQEDNEKCDPL